MGKKEKTHTLLIVLLFLAISPIIVLQPLAAQPSNQPLNIEFQKAYGDSNTAGVSNMIQTTDGGYIFMDWGRSHYWNLESAIFYKIDPSGNMQWNKTIPQFHPSSVIQNSEEGYELLGIDNSSTPTLIKLNSQGDIQSIAKNWNLPYQIGVESFRIIHEAEDGSIKTSDGGYAKWTHGSIIKTDSYNNTEWIENFTYPSEHSTGFSPLPFFSLIETSDGALAALGVGYYRLSNQYTGTIYLIKTEPFLPQPSPQELPAPITIDNRAFILLTPIIVVLIVLLISLMLLRRHRKTSNLSK